MAVGSPREILGMDSSCVRRIIINSNISMNSADQEKQQLLERIRQLEEQNASMQRMVSGQSATTPHTPTLSPRKKIINNKISNIWHTRRRVSLVEVFSLIGAIIVCIGVVILITINWDQMGTGMRILCTLGIGALMHGISIFCFKYERLRLSYVGYALYLISTFVIPYGFFVVIDSFEAEVTPGIHLLIAVLVFFIHTASYIVLRKTLCTLAMLASFSWIFLALTSLMFQKSALVTSEIAFLQLFVLGLFYSLLGLVLAHTNRRDFTMPLYVVGTLSLFLSIFNPDDWWSDGGDPLISPLLRILLATFALAAMHILYFYTYNRSWFLFAGVISGTGLFISLTSLMFGTDALVAHNIQFFQLITVAIFYSMFGLVMSRQGRARLAALFYLGGTLLLSGESLYLLLTDSYYGLFEIFETPLLELLIVSLALTCIHIFYYRFYAQPQFFLVSILAGAGVFFAVTQMMVASTDYADSSLFFAIRFFIVGLVYMLFAYLFNSRTDQQLIKKHISLSTFLYLLGSTTVLVSGFYFNDQGGRDGNFVWEILYPVFIMGFIALSVYIQSKITLLVSFFALMGYIALVTSYFEDDSSFSWPIAIIVLGFLFIGIGYVPIYIKRKFFAN